MGGLLGKANANANVHPGAVQVHSGAATAAIHSGAVQFPTVQRGAVQAAACIESGAAQGTATVERGAAQGTATVERGAVQGTATVDAIGVQEGRIQEQKYWGSIPTRLIFMHFFR